MHKNPENKISQTAHKHYNQFIRVINKALRWLQIATNTGKKTKVKKKSNKDNNNYWISLQLMYLKFNNNNLHIRK